MRMLRRNTVRFEYLAYRGEREKLIDGRHTGNTEPVYDDPVEYRGHISVPTGYATDNQFGVNTQYTHVLLMDKPDADIQEEGIVVWNGNEYDVQAVRPSFNVLSVALRKRTKNHAPAGWQPSGQTGATGATGGD